MSLLSLVSASLTSAARLTPLISSADFSSALSAAGASAAGASVLASASDMLLTVLWTRMCDADGDAEEKKMPH